MSPFPICLNLIWLDTDSPSAAWVKADIAWEDDLEPLETEETL